MTMLAFSAAMLGIPVDVGRLYDGNDPHFAAWVATITDMVSEARRKQNA